jgi:hypothetical protein
MVHVHHLYCTTASTTKHRPDFEAKKQTEQVTENTYKDPLARTFQHKTKWQDPEGLPSHGTADPPESFPSVNKLYLRQPSDQRLYSCGTPYFNKDKQPLSSPLIPIPPQKTNHRDTRMPTKPSPNSKDVKSMTCLECTALWIPAHILTKWDLEDPKST